MLQRLTRYGGVGLFLLGLGVQVAGWTNAAVGVSLMALGVLWEVGAIAGPLVVNRTRTAIVKSVLEEFKKSLEASSEAQGVDRKRWLKGVSQRLHGELTVAGERLEDARRQGRYWHADVYTLTADEWAASHNAVSDEPELQEHYMQIRLAYERLNRINTIIIERRHHPSFPSQALEQSDRIDDAIARVDEAALRLQEVGDSL